MVVDRKVSPSVDPPVLERFEWTASSSVSTAVVETVATVSNEDPTELPLLYDVIDPDALDALVTHASNSLAQERATVTFEFNGYHVEVTSAGDGYVLSEAETPESDVERV